jgi:hypothetical protein
LSAALDRSTPEPQATFADCKRELIACLREAWSRGPRDRPFDLEWAWRMIEVIAAAMAEAPSATPRELREQALELAKALGEVRTILESTIKARPDLANQIRWAWIWLATGGASAASVLSGQTPTDGAEKRLQQAVGGVCDLEDAANLVAQWNHKPRGNQQGSGWLPTESVLLLAHVYARTTELQPTTTETGLFMDFVRAVRDTFDIPLRDDAVHRVVKIALRHRKNVSKATC